MHIQLYEHSNKYNILADEQFGFRNKLATNNAIYKLINEIRTALNNKITIGGIFCYLEKAFDCIIYKILLSKLDYCGVNGKAKLLFESYLSNRDQRILITDKKLKQKNSSHG